MPLPPYDDPAAPPIAKPAGEPDPVSEAIVIGTSLTLTLGTIFLILFKR